MPLERKNELKEGKQGFLHEEGNKKKIDERKKEVLLRSEKNQIEGGNLIGKEDTYIGKEESPQKRRK